MGHSTTRAALIYLHGSDEGQRKLAATVSEQARAVTTAPELQVAESGTDLARDEDQAAQDIPENGDASRWRVAGGSFTPRPSQNRA
jgi:hypothetical protein